MSEDIRDKMTEYKADAKDGDGDGMVQDATPYERPEGTDLTEEQLAAIEEEGKTASDVIDAKVEGGSDEVNVLAPVEDGVIGSSKTKKPAPKPTATKAASTGSTTAIHSRRNISWVGVGRIKKGYNFVDSSEADQWATLEGVRIADPSEIQGLS